MKPYGISLILILAASIGFTGCGSNNNPTLTDKNPVPVVYSFSTFFGSSGTTPMDYPVGIAVSGSTLWVANGNSGNLQAWSTGGSLLRTVTSNISDPGGVAAGPDGDIYVMNYTSKQISEYLPDGTFEVVFGNAQLTGTDCLGVAVDATEAYASTNNELLAFPISGTGPSKTFGTPVTFGNSGQGQVSDADQLAVDGAGNVYVADDFNERIAKYSPGGTFQMGMTLAGGGMPTGVALDASGNVFALDTANSEIQEFNSSGAAVTIFGQGDLGGIHGQSAQLAIDAAGNLYADDGQENQIVVFSKN